MKARQSTQQNRSENHSPIDTDTRKVVSSVAPAHAAGSDPAEQFVGSNIPPEVLRHIERVKEGLSTLKNDGIDPAFFTTPLRPNQIIADEWRRAHNGEEPTLDETLGEAFKQARELFAGRVPDALPPKTLPPASEIAAAPLQLDPNPVPNRDVVNRCKSRPRRQYRSCLKRHIQNYLTSNPNASAAQVCGHVDEQGLADDAFPSTWMKNGTRELTVAYKDEEVRPLINAMISKVRHDLRT